MMSKLQDLLPISLSLLIKVLIFIAAIFVFNYLKNTILRKIVKRLEKKSGVWDKSLVSAAIYPSSALLWLLVTIYSLQQLIQVYPNAILISTILYHIKAVGVILIVSWFLLSLITQVESNYYKEVDKDSTLDTSSSNVVGKVSRALVAVFTVVIILQIYHYPLSALLTIGGAGSFAIGFAAKDMLANFFGGLTVYMDKPFKVGDWIKFQDGKIEGIVERIGWRSTRLRNFDKRPVYIPNNLWVSSPVENVTRMVNRRIKETIGLRYKDADKISVIVEDIQNMLVEHPNVDHRQTCVVRFSGFADSALNIMIYFFTKKVQFSEFSEIKESILLSIIKIVHKHEADFAFPTRTVELISK